MRKMTRRDILRTFSVASLAASFLPKDLFAVQDKVLLGDGHHKYEWIKDWAKLPEGMPHVGSTHGNIAIDAKDRVYINTDTENAVMIFNPDGTFVKSWGREFKGGAHGMSLVKEDGKEVLWLCHIKRSEVVKCSLDGEVLMVVPFPEKAGVYKDKKEYKPTGVAVAPNGDFYIGDGYGASWVHQWNARGEYLRSWDGSEREGGKFKTPHGMALDLRGPTPRVIVADRENGRLQLFTLEGKFVSEVREGLRRPCTLYILGEDIVIPDLAGRITILDRNNKLVAHLGENSDTKKHANFRVQPGEWKDGEFTAPHGAAWDSKGDLYVEDWNIAGRINKLKRVR